MFSRDAASLQQLSLDPITPWVLIAPQADWGGGAKNPSSGPVNMLCYGFPFCYCVRSVINCG